MSYISTDWRTLLFAEPYEIPSIITLSSPFTQEFLKKQTHHKKYSAWVRQLHRCHTGNEGISGVYIIGWQPIHTEEPVFYVGSSSKGWLYQTFTQHFTGNYGEVSGYEAKRAVIPTKDYKTCKAAYIPCPMMFALKLENKLIRAYYEGDFPLLNNYIPSLAYVDTPKEMVSIFPTEESEYSQWLNRAEYCMKYTNEIYGIEAYNQECYSKLLSLIEYAEECIKPPF